MRRALPALLALGALLAPQADTGGRDAPEVLRAFAPLAQGCARGVVTVLQDGAPVALATAVDAAGLLVTKSSEVADALELLLADGATCAARVVARDPVRDLALLRAEDVALEPPRWDAAPPAPGRLVTAAGPGGAPLAIGLVGVAPRRIEGGRGRLGVVLAFGPGAVVARVTPGSPAELAGLLPGDRIVAVGGREVSTRAEAARRIRECKAGETARLLLRRDEDELELEALLAALPSGGGGRRARLQGALSGLRAGFPDALQHDCVLAPEECGGPLVGLDGRALGVNIARAGRVASYAIPAADVLAAVEELKARALR